MCLLEENKLYPTILLLVHKAHANIHRYPTTSTLNDMAKVLILKKNLPKPINIFTY